ncbi:O-antigen ligase family protein [Butyricimonas virosa]|jgi:O-antigen ligase|uniref:O-antigen ligase family protein n=3 Tax=Butyricimonas virosa TaxID=544645 RepID=A0A413IN75_9BACT|nr:O-antigen ligase family protein [Butyricimonas virosa]MCI7293024.1 O-antigen ligase family protein [Butyricimonas virosa]MDY5013724.1 O-antigen ligase family protein [Butyricimonas virosa]MDY6220615.1 O-antigen ligase family protein [Butyricimonas virosa]RGL88864.1 O-antigen ligase family protein [Butyricimonas virosa]RGY17567.1 O-antigen ligase family protein [Butyricimonas virosa]
MMMRAIVFLGGCMLLLSQFQVTDGLYGGIDISNYFALLLGAMVAIVCLVKAPKALYRGDAMVFVLFVYLLIHASLTHAMQSREFYLSISYFGLYVVFRVIRAMRLANYVSFAVMFGGIYQSCLVLGQLLGYGISNHLRFVVTGSFFNPGPCGIFLAGVFVLAVAMMKKGYRKVGINLMFVRYVTACVTFGVTLVALVPTMSRAGWIGALVGVMLLYRREIVAWGNTRRRWVIGGGIVGMIVVLTLFYLLKKDSANGRLFIWQNTVSAYWKTPLFGVGIDGFERAFAEAQHDYFEKEKVLEQDNRHVEMAGVVESAFNEPLALFLLLGAVGGVLAAMVLFFKLQRLTAYSCVAVALLVASFFSYTFYIPSIAIVFLFAVAQLPDRRVRGGRYVNVLMFGIMGIVVLFFDFREFGRREAYRKWKNNAVYYTWEDYQSVVKEYGKLYPVLKNDFKFLFEYGHSLHKVGRYEESNIMLKRGIRHSADPMFWNIAGNNYLALKQYDQGMTAYLRAYYTCPNRVYPLYLLTKLEAERGDTTMMNYYGRILLGKRPKVPSLAVDEMKFEIRKMLDVKL